MGSESRWVKLRDITSKITKGTTPTKKDGGFTDTGINYIKAESVGYDGRIDESKFAYISPTTHDQLKRSQLEESDILFSMAGAFLGKTGFVLKRHLPANTNQALALVRVIQELAFPKYVHLYLQQKKVVHFVNNSVSQSAQPNINLQQIGDLDIYLLPLEQQRKIVDCLNALDNKITLNRQINQTLEQMAQTLFKSWFVDFDPVIDNAMDAGNAIPDELQVRAEQRQALRNAVNEANAENQPHSTRTNPATGDALASPYKPLPDDIRQLFPNEFEESELGWVPKGWGVTSLYDTSDFINGAAYKKFEPNSVRSGLPIIKIAELKNGINDGTGFSDIDMPAKYLINNRDILFSWSGNPETSIDTFVWCLGDAWLNQHIFKVIPKDSTYRWYILLLLKFLKPVFTAIARDKQTTGLGHVTVKDLKALNICLPSTSLIAALDDIFSDTCERQYQTNEQNIVLAHLRDTLLPKLISGELRLDEVESTIAETTTA